MYNLKPTKELTIKKQANADYIAKLDDSIKQAERGEVVMYTKEQMRVMEKRTALSKGLSAMYEAHEQSIINGTSDMTLDEINDIIKKCRQKSQPGI